jgi:hypothetical protein
VNSRSWRRRGDSICQERIKTIPMTDPAAASHQESEKSPLRSIYSPIAGLPARSCWWRLWCMSQHAIQKDSFCSCEDSSGFVLFILACRTDYLLAHRRAPPEMMGAITSVSLITRPPARSQEHTHSDSLGFTQIPPECRRAGLLTVFPTGRPRRQPPPRQEVRPRPPCGKPFLRIPDDSLFGAPITITAAMRAGRGWLR